MSVILFAGSTSKSFLFCFKIVSEESVGSGVRRIECVTKMQAYKALKTNEIKLNDLRDSLKLKNSDMISGRVDQMKQNISSLENEKAQLLLRVLNLDSDVAASKAKGEDIKYVVLKTSDLQYNLKYAMD